MCQVGILNPKEISLIMSGRNVSRVDVFKFIRSITSFYSFPYLRTVPDIKIIKARMDKSPSELHNTQVKPIAY